MRPALSILVLLLLLAASGCTKSPDAGLTIYTGTNLGTNGQQRLFQVKGVVLEVKPREKSVTIKHEDVPGYMPGMTMPFDVRDTNELTGLVGTFKVG